MNIEPSHLVSVITDLCNDFTEEYCLEHNVCKHEANFAVMTALIEVLAKISNDFNKGISK